MSVDKHSFKGDDGALYDILDIDLPNTESEYDEIRIRRDPTDKENIMQVVGYKDDKAVYQSNFKIQEFEFTPVTSMNNEDREDIHEEIQIALNAIGLGVVPSGDWWRKP